MSKIRNVLSLRDQLLKELIEIARTASDVGISEMIGRAKGIAERRPSRLAGPLCQIIKLGARITERNEARKATP